MRLLLAYLFAILGLGMAGAALGQPVTLLQAYQSTINQNPQLRGEQSYVKADKARVDDAWAQVKPQVDFTAGLGKTWYKRDLGFRDIEDGADDPSRLDIGVSQVIYSRRAFKGIDEAERAVDKTRAQFVATRSEVGFEALQAFLDIRRLQRLQTVLEEELASHQRQTRQLQEMLERGFTTRAALLEAQSRADEVKARVVRLENDRKVAMQTLRRLTSLPISALVPVDETRWQSTRGFLSQDWQGKALANAPSLEVSRAEKRLAATSRKVAAAGHYPDVSLRARYTDNDSFATSLLEEQRVEIQVSIPIYKGGSTSARTRAARYREEGAKWLLANEKQQVRVEVERLTAQLDGSLSNIRALEQALASARASENAAAEGFNAGVRDLTALLDIRKRRSNIEQEWITAVYENLSLRLQLLALAGELDTQQLANW